MTEKQALFCKGLAEGLTEKQAAERAGFKGAAAVRRLRQLPEVVRQLEAMEDRRQETVAGQEEVLGQLTRLSRQEELPLRERLHVLELLGKHYGLFDGKGGGGETVWIVDDLP